MARPTTTRAANSTSPADTSSSSVTTSAPMAVSPTATIGPSTRTNRSSSRSTSATIRWSRSPRCHPGTPAGAISASRATTAERISLSERKPVSCVASRSVYRNTPLPVPNARTARIATDRAANSGCSLAFTINQAAAPARPIVQTSAAPPSAAAPMKRPRTGRTNESTRLSADPADPAAVAVCDVWCLTPNVTSGVESDILMSATCGSVRPARTRRWTGSGRSSGPDHSAT